MRRYFSHKDFYQEPLVKVLLLRFELKIDKKNSKSKTLVLAWPFGKTSSSRSTNLAKSKVITD